ncbi:histidine kinase [Roseiconus lacunae]|uniref:Histidine kinase n=1 Tax=Roseiconus lacunae TaxID=2605694 RepID=A0ABT7PIX8_9BACT|nr:histidine kinase [Roseiconus lacunae]MCD0458573.1 histidine kinase [Roseiconus lacunae]MDM4016461.1 histidine kinase [Roseiconus lacunae]WRQ51938.1 histidine kinase [Stieleria sp. HD01]
MSDQTVTSSNESPDKTPTVVFLSGDLIFASRVRAAAQQAGYVFRLSGSLPEADAIEFVIVDLSTRSGVLETLADNCSRVCPTATTIAYGPHVQEEQLNRARDVGIDQVMTRGQFDRSLATLFRKT